MHYIRLLRPASVDKSNPRAPTLSLKIAITTDLGDTFLNPKQPVKLRFRPRRIGTIAPENRVQRTKSNEGPFWTLPDMRTFPMEPVNGPAIWKKGTRVLKVELPWQWDLSEGRVNLDIECPFHGKNEVSAANLQLVLPWQRDGILEEKHNMGLIAPLTLELNNGQCSDFAVRDFFNYTSEDIFPNMHLYLEEDIGESIARHIWDAGLVTAAVLVDGARFSGSESRADRLEPIIPITKPKINFLELGSGVGILGITLGMVARGAAKVQGVELEHATVLLTDLPEAEERARANINRRQDSRHNLGPGDEKSEVLYENLDWNDGAEGKFGPIVSSHFWDYVVLSDCTYNVDSFPVLVKTLSAIHAHNEAHATSNDAAATKPTTRVVLSTKPRHDSEKALFGMLEEAGWEYSLFGSIKLPRMGAKGEEVEVYAIEKGPEMESRKRKANEELIAGRDKVAKTGP